MRRPQFGLKSLIWLVFVVASFFAGASWQRQEFQRDRLRYEQDRQRWELNRREFTNLVFRQRERIESLAE